MICENVGLIATEMSQVNHFEFCHVIHKRITGVPKFYDDEPTCKKFALLVSFVSFGETGGVCTQGGIDKAQDDMVMLR